MSSDDPRERLPARMEPLHPAIAETGPRAIATLETHPYEAPPGLRDYVSMLQRRKWAILISLGAVFALSIIVTAVTPRTYESTATLLISELAPKSSKPTDSQDAMAAMGSPNLDTHVQL
ncbi:MAG: Wzz/FepE/Etk N-terminal domain-containing protein, partial [Thermoleophilia bacterium]|nr:Wzz/FepE/Etk N-terminal domain-containing protein [Thermoleophilia bacterium]